MSRLSLAAALAVVLMLGGAHAFGDQPAFGVIKAPSFEQAKSQTFAWLKEAKADAAVLQQAEAIWDAKTDRSLLDRVAETAALVDPDARDLVTASRDGLAPAPSALPALLKDNKRPPFVRSNLSLYFAKHQSSRRVYEESLEALKGIRPEQVVDPASYYFFKAVAENRLLKKDDGLQSIDRLLSSVADVPERYAVVATLMKHEMQVWKDEDLGHVARLMGEIEGRLDIARGGPKTQAKQKEVIDLLTKMIEDIEKQCSA
jgi:hypothetical protein